MTVDIIIVARCFYDYREHSDVAGSLIRQGDVVSGVNGDDLVVLRKRHHISTAT